MGKRKTPKININFSSKGKQTVGRVFYKWAVDAGRAIIVGIELIALLALGYRMIIDRKIVDMHDQINIQQAYIAAQAKDESTYRGIQDRLKNIKITDEDTQAKVQVMNEILETISNGTFFNTNLSISNDSIIAEGNSFSVSTLNDFIESVKKLPSIDSISLDEISTTDTGVKFKISINIKSSDKT
jgi:hypothetical protein